MDATQFRFSKLSESELKVADAYLDAVKRLYDERERNLDPKDPEYATLLDEINKLFQKKDFVELTAEELEALTREIDKKQQSIKAINERNLRLTQKYGGDDKFMRIHKRIEEDPASVTTGERLIQLLKDVKTSVDDTISTNESLLDNVAYFDREVQRSILQASQKPTQVNCDLECIKQLASLVTDEYQNNMRSTL